jgi:eukaryotic-like serine/threonine-protein kinase
MPSELNILKQALAISDDVERARYLDRVIGRDLAMREKIEHQLKYSHKQLTPGSSGARELGHDQAAGPVGETAVLFGGEPLPGDLIDAYRIRERLGEGGFGLVYLAEQIEPVRRKVALKVIKPGMDSREVIVRFEAERQALAMMDHPNIARVFDAGTTSTGRPYFVMELVRGVTITQYCDEAKLGISQRLELFNDVCRAVQHAHQKGIIHRDLKPGNILVTRHDGRPVVKVIDFGVAKALHQKLGDQTVYTRLAQMLGTPLYMSPEQAEMSSQDIDTRSDIYSLGVLLYELLTGSTPFDRKLLASAALDEVRRIIREEEPPRPSTRLSESGDRLPSIAALRHSEPARLSRLVRGDLDWIVMKALDKDRNRRYETANGLARDVERYIQNEPVDAGPPGAAYRLRKFVYRNRPQVVLGATVFVLLLAGIFGTSWQWWHASTERDRAQQERKEKELALIREQDARFAAQEAAVSERTARESADLRLAQVRRAVELIGDVFTSLDPATPGSDDRHLRDLISQRLAELSTKLEGELVSSDWEDEFHLQLTLGQSLTGLGRYREATPVFQRALGLAEKHGGRVSLAAQMVRADLALGHVNELDYEKAILLLDELVPWFERELGPSHETTWAARNTLASALLGTGQVQRAADIYDSNLATLETVSGTAGSNILTAKHNLANALRLQGKYDEALKLLRSTMTECREKLGSEAPRTLVTQNVLAMTLDAAGRKSEALKLFEQTLGSQRLILGNQHRDTLITQKNLADCLCDGMEFERAIPLLESFMDAWKMQGETSSALILGCQVRLARCYSGTGQKQKARNMLEEILKARTGSFAPDDIETMSVVGNLAKAFTDDGDFKTGLPMHEQYVALCMQKYGANNLHTIGAMNNMAFACQDANQPDKAAEIFAQILPAATGIVGGRNQLTVSIQINLGSAYLASGQIDLAISTVEELVDPLTGLSAEQGEALQSARFVLVEAYQADNRMADAVALQRLVLQDTLVARPGTSKTDIAFRRRARASLIKALTLAGSTSEVVTEVASDILDARNDFPPNSTAFAGVLASGCQALLGLGEAAAAEPYCRECLEIREANEPEAWTTPGARALLGQSLLGQGKFAEAEPLLLAAIEGLKKREAHIPPAGKHRIPEILESLVKLYETWNKPEEAAKWRQELDAMKAASIGEKVDKK